MWYNGEVFIQTQRFGTILAFVRSTKFRLCSLRYTWEHVQHLIVLGSKVKDNRS